MFLLTLYTSNYISALALVDSLTVRIHTGIVHGKPWARFWYLCRAIDLSGTGIVEFDVHDVCRLLKVCRPTLYEWLRKGRAAGAFRCYRFRKNELKVYLGGLHKYCLALGVSGWGEVALVSLTDILEGMALKSHATALQTQVEQVRSRVACIRSLKKRERQSTKIPEPATILKQGKQSSQKPAKGQVPFLLWVGGKRIFVSKSFVPYGASQERIAGELGISDRTVRRHLDYLGVERRQLVQAKAAYKTVAHGMDCWADQVVLSEDRIEYYEASNEGYQVGTMYEPSGRTCHTHGFRVRRDRFFNYRGKTWLYRCNLYLLDYDTTSMKTSRKRLAQLIEFSRRDGGETPIKESNQCPNECNEIQENLKTDEDSGQPEPNGKSQTKSIIF